MICTVSCSSSLQVCNDTQEASQLWCIPPNTPTICGVFQVDCSNDNIFFRWNSPTTCISRFWAFNSHDQTYLTYTCSIPTTWYTCVYIYIYIPELLLKRTKDFCTLNSRSGERRSCMLSLLSRFRIMNPWPGEDTLGERRRHPYFFSYSDKPSTAQPVW